MADYPCLYNPEFKMLAKIILKVVLNQGNKLLVFADWIAEIHLYSMALDLLNIKVANIRAGMTANQRKEVIKRFNDPLDKSIQILVCSSRSAAESINLQKGCADIVVFDMVSYNTLVQIAGRVHRLTQTRNQRVWILTLDRTYDQVFTASYTRNMVAQMAATMGRYGYTDEVHANFSAQVDVAEEIKDRTLRDHEKDARRTPRIFGSALLLNRSIKRRSASDHCGLSVPGAKNRTSMPSSTYQRKEPTSSRSVVPAKLW